MYQLSIKYLCEILSFTKAKIFLQTHYFLSKNFVLVSTMLTACHAIQHYFTQWACQIWFIARMESILKNKQKQPNSVLKQSVYVCLVHMKQSKTVDKVLEELNQ